MANPDDKGQAELSADTDGEGFARVDGKYLADVLKACGGMVDFKLTSPISPMTFSLDGYQVVVMPMITEKANEWQKAQAKATEQATTEDKPTKPAKPKAKKAKQPVTAK
jgi:DNA polymerase-3 subunit beta